jgi:HEAT repeat protein
MAGAACKAPSRGTESSPERASATPAGGDAEVAAAAGATEGRPATEEEKLLWKELLDRSRCGLLPGCDAAWKLVALGPDVAARAAVRLEADKSDRQWKVELARALSRVRDDRIRNWQRRALADPLWPIRAYAAVGLGRSRDPEFVSAAKDQLARERHPGMRVAILWALALARDQEARPRLVRMMAGLPATPDIRIDLVAMEAVADLTLTETLPDVRSRLEHSNLFVLRAAARTVKALLDRSSIPLLIALLDHETELVRNAALDTLRYFTGQKHRTTREAFERWCEQYCKADWPRPSGSGQTKK